MTGAQNTPFVSGDQGQTQATKPEVGFSFPELQKESQQNGDHCPGLRLRQAAIRKVSGSQDSFPLWPWVQAFLDSETRLVTYQYLCRTGGPKCQYVTWFWIESSRELDKGNGKNW